MPIIRMPVDADVTLFRRGPDRRYSVLQRGLPATVPAGDISVLIVRDGQLPVYVPKLDAGTIIEVEPPPDDAAGRAWYYRQLDARRQAEAEHDLVRRYGSARPILLQYPSPR